jgi:hypothetical protein
VIGKFRNLQKFRFRNLLYDLITFNRISCKCMYVVRYVEAMYTFVHVVWHICISYVCMCACSAVYMYKLCVHTCMYLCSLVYWSYVYTCKYVVRYVEAVYTCTHVCGVIYRSYIYMICDAVWCVKAMNTCTRQYIENKFESFSIFSFETI